MSLLEIEDGHRTGLQIIHSVTKIFFFFYLIHVVVLSLCLQMPPEPSRQDKSVDTGTEESGSAQCTEVGRQGCRQAD